MSTTAKGTKLLIVSVSPQNLEWGVLWFKQNLAAVKKARSNNPWWRENALFVQKDQIIRPSLFIRRLMELGYERVGIVRGRGLFAVRGGVIEVWPVNSDSPYLIEFAGNTITALVHREVPPIEAKPRLYRGFASIEKLPVGSYIVHVDHGIGILRGREDGYFIVEYAAPAAGRSPDRLLVPLDQRERLSPYVGFATPTIHRLGGTLWANTRRRVREEAEKMARSLLALYTSRHRVKRPPHNIDQTFMRELSESFQHEITEGQLNAEREISGDLALDRPMDRLLVGDVGFGKTEIAIRASLAVISSGKQVVVLAPTTILAAQHERTFQERLAKLPIVVRMLSRLTPQNQTKKILEKLGDGKIDCVIGTHRLLSRDVRFKNLGLVIIDEEQRFGVKQKERFKELRAEIDPVRGNPDVCRDAAPLARTSNGVDVLSLSATPIPRTLSLALAKLRDISRIDTPPAGRIPIVTAVLPYGKKIIKDAITLELERGGQVYLLHNRIGTIGIARDRLQKLLRPITLHSLRIGILHGRMKEKELIKAMDAFRNKEIDVLLATTIIENGLDISSANTLIVDDATRLGLAEAHQLRGRIGRADAQAFAYFLYRPQRLTEKAEKRLEALKEYADLGAGYEIALRDLEIRGAGNILGREQSGAINKVGLNLYCQMLAEATEQLQS